jgi:tetratricopeptide (TPR) repeat protein
VALKVLRLDAAREPRAVLRFRREAQAAARLHHTNIVPVFEVGQDGDTAFYAMQLIPGRGLDQVIDELRRQAPAAAAPTTVVAADPAAGLAPSLRTGGFCLHQTPSPDLALADAERASSVAPTAPESSVVLAGLSDGGAGRTAFYRAVARIGEQVASALAYAHARGIVHRDVKPSNLLLDASGVVWVADFGLAKADDSDALTHTGDVVGTLRYMAPERFKGRANAGADVYALGLTLYELLALRPAFGARDRLELIEQIKNQEPARPRSLDSGIPRDLETVVLKAMNKDPGRRYPSAQHLADDLRRWLAGEPVQARPMARLERGWRWARRNPLPATLAVVLALAVTAGLATALALWRNAERHLGEEEAARRESEAHYRTCRRLLGEYVAVTRDLRLHSPAARREQRQALAKARAFCEGLGRQRPGDLAVQRVLAEVCTALAALDAHDGQLDEARQAGETARALWQELGAATPDADCADGLASVLSTLGLVYGHLGRNAEAAASLRQALALWDRLSGHGTEGIPALVAACQTRRELALRLRDVGPQPDEDRMYRENCARLERAAGGVGAPPELRLELLVNLAELGETYQHDGNRADAERCWRRGYELGRRLTEEIPDSAVAVYHLAMCGRELAAKDPAAAPPEETAVLCTQAARLLEAQRLRDPADRDCSETMARVCWMLADSYIQAGKPAEAARAARRAAVVLADLADRHPDDPGVRLHALLGQSRLAEREGRCGDPSAARRSARQAADGLERFFDCSSADPRSLALAAGIGCAIAPGLRHAGVPDEALRVVRCCLRTSERLVHQYPDEPVYRVLLSEAWTHLGKANWSAKHFEQAEAALRAAAAVADSLAARWPDYRPLRDDRLRRLRRLVEDRGSRSTKGPRR